MRSTRSLPAFAAVAVYLHRVDVKPGPGEEVWIAVHACREK
jgi:hypothetical protein